MNSHLIELEQSYRNATSQVDKDMILREIMLFNPFHKGKGPGGGQFTSKTGGSAASSGPSKSKVSGMNKTRTPTHAIVGWGIGGGLAGMLAGNIVGATVGGLAATAAIFSFGLSLESASAIAQVGGFVGQVAGTWVGAGKGIEHAMKRHGELGDVGAFTLAEADGVSKLLAVLQEFLKGDRQRFAVKRSQNPSFVKLGFKESGEYLYADKGHVKKVVDAIIKMKGAGAEAK